MNFDKSESTKEYRNIFRAASLFGGVQVIKIIIEIIKQKFIAILLGPTGMGVSGIYISTISLIQAFTSLGLSTSSVKYIANAYGSGNKEHVNKATVVVKKIIWFSSLIGSIIFILASPFLSKISFGNYDYTIPFIFLSLSLLFQQLSTGQSAIIQGLRKIKYLAKANIFGSVLGLLISIPIYYFLGIKGIVPTIILNSLSILIITTFYFKKIYTNNCKLTTKETILESKEMIKMGIALSLNSILVLFFGYLIRIYILQNGGIDEVGFYTAGFAIVNGYVGLIFTAMGTDYFPRLSEACSNKIKSNQIINQQTEISILIISPIVIIFLLFAPFAIKVFYSIKFIPILGLLQWSIIGMLLKTNSWAISFQFIANSDMKIFMINEIVANIIVLTLNIVCYTLWGLEGIGIAFTLSFLIYFIIVYIAANYKYGFKYNKSLLKVMTLQFILVFGCFYLVKYTNQLFFQYIVYLLCFFSIILSIKVLKKRLNINLY